VFEADAIHQHIDEHLNEHIAKIQEYVRQPSVSGEDRGMHECAELLLSHLQRLGCAEAELVETPEHPCIWAYYDAGAQKTIVNHGYYDVQPVEDEAWTHPPFAAELVEMPPFKSVLVGRGSFNSKGSYRAWLNALESIIAVHGNLPVNIMFTIDGQQEVGSPHFPSFIRRYEDRLRTADAVLTPTPSQEADGTVHMFLGVKGTAFFEIECSGKAWGKGPQDYDISGGTKAFVDSPAWRMIHALASMTSEDGNTVLIDGFYENAVPPSEEDMELVEKLVESFDDAPWKEQCGVKRWMDDASGRELIMRYLFGATLNIDGIWGGDIGPARKSVVPHTVRAKLDARLVPNMGFTEIVNKVRAHLDKLGYTDIQFAQVTGYEWAKTSASEPVVQAVLDVYRRCGIEPAVWPNWCHSLPLYLFAGDPLHLPVCRGGLGHGGRPHSPDEYLVIEGNDRVAGLARAEKSFVDILHSYASA